MEQLINAGSMTAKSSNVKESMNFFGTRFSKNPKPEKLIARCDEQLANCKKWIKNLEQLKREQLKLQALAKKDEIKSYLSSLSKEELQDIMASDIIEDAIIIED